MTLLSVTRGDRTQFAITLVDGAGDPINLTGISVVFTAKSDLLDIDADAVIAKSDTNGIAIDADPSTGLCTLTLDPEDTQGLADATRLYWDIQLDDGAGDVRTPLSGRLAIAADVTETASATS